MTILRVCPYILALLSFAAAFDVGAEAESGQPYLPVCTGYNSSRKDWALSIEVHGDQDRSCEPGSAMMALEERTKPYFTASESIRILGSCCPLPEDALAGPEIIAGTECPPDFVATGAIGIERPDGGDSLLDKRPKFSFYFKCRKINTARYRLGPETNGWEFGPRGDYFKRILGKPWNVAVNRTVRARMPAALRYGLMRSDQHFWEETGCVGHPWGSLLVGRSYLHCTGAKFRQLLLVNENQRRPVLPEHCARLDNIFSGTPRCLE